MADLRLIHLKQLMALAGLDFIALNPGPSLTYLTGLHFHLMERPTILLLHRDKPPVLILPELELIKVPSSRVKLTPITYNDDPSTWQRAFVKAAHLLGLTGGRIGVEPSRWRYLEADILRKALPDVVLVAADSVFGNLRTQKESVEIAEMRRAVQIAQAALEKTLSFIKTGMTEKDIAAELTIQLLQAGSDPELPFSPIIAAGPNSANPHATPSSRALKEGDLLVIDWGARSNGYCSDLTRTFAIGKIDPELQRIYEIAQESNAAGRLAGAPGIQAGKVDDAARVVIDKAGYGQYFTHRTGHGLGMEEHETPYIFSNNTLDLLPGMTYTVEPGIYLPGRGGVRIEDNMVITPSGSESMSDYPRGLVTL